MTHCPTRTRVPVAVPSPWITNERPKIVFTPRSFATSSRNVYDTAPSTAVTALPLFSNPTCCVGPAPTTTTTTPLTSITIKAASSRDDKACPQNASRKKHSQLHTTLRTSPLRLCQAQTPPSTATWSTRIAGADEVATSGRRRRTGHVSKLVDVEGVVAVRQTRHVQRYHQVAVQVLNELHHTSDVWSCSGARDVANRGS